MLQVDVASGGLLDRYRELRISMTGEGIAKVLGGVSSLVWTGLAFYVVWLLRTSISGAVNRLTGVEGWGVKFALSGGGQAMAAAFEVAAKNSKWPAAATEQECQAALAKARTLREVFEGTEILWVDDCPSNNRNESRMLRSFGTQITFACTSDEAIDAIRDAHTQLRPFRIVLSDISRNLPPPMNPRAGLDMLTRFHTEGIHIPVIFYVGNPRPEAETPAGAFGITHRPDILLTLVGDALERVRSR
jgi:CheY-like chemotaxis protein